jgi:heme exporter protein CcmD
MLGPHTAFILGAYGVTAAGIFALVVWIALDYRAQRHSLDDLEARRAKKK